MFHKHASSPSQSHPHPHPTPSQPKNPHPIPITINTQPCSANAKSYPSILIPYLPIPFPLPISTCVHAINHSSHTAVPMKEHAPIHPSNTTILINKSNIPRPLRIPRHKLLIPRRSFILRVPRQHALNRHTHALHILHWGPALCAEKI